MRTNGRPTRRPDARSSRAAIARDSSCGGEAQVAVAHAGVDEELGGGPRERDAARFEDVGAVGEREGMRHVLLDEDDRHAARADGPERREDLADEERGETQGRLVQQEQTRLRLSLIHISEPTRLGMISYAVFC